MDKNLTNKKDDKLKRLIKERMELINEHLDNYEFKYASIEIRALKSYLKCQVAIAKKRAKMNRLESMREEEIES